MTKQLESEQGNLSVYQERQAKAAALKADCENQLADAQNKLAAEEKSRQDLTADKKRMEGEIGVIKKDIEDDLSNKVVEVKKRPTGTTTFALSMMKLLPRMRSLTSSTRKRRVFLTTSQRQLRIYKLLRIR